MKKRLLVILMVLLVSSGAIPAWALLIPRMTTEELVLHANTIVSGRCLSFHYHPGHHGKTLYAIIQFKVDEYLKNDLGKTELTLQQIAREEGMDGTPQPGAISFSVDEEAILFLTEEDQQGFRHIMGLPQGKFSIGQNRRGKPILVRDLTGVRFFDRKTGEISKVKQPHEERDLETFREELKRIASHLKAEKQELVFVSPDRSF